MIAKQQLKKSLYTLSLFCSQNERNLFQRNSTLNKVLSSWNRRAEPNISFNSLNTKPTNRWPHNELALREISGFSLQRLENKCSVINME